MLALRIPAMPGDARRSRALSSALSVRLGECLWEKERSCIAVGRSLTSMRSFPSSSRRRAQTLARFRKAEPSLCQRNYSDRFPRRSNRQPTLADTPCSQLRNARTAKAKSKPMEFLAAPVWPHTHAHTRGTTRTIVFRLSSNAAFETTCRKTKYVEHGNKISAAAVYSLKRKVLSLCLSLACLPLAVMSIIPEPLATNERRPRAAQTKRSASTSSGFLSFRVQLVRVECRCFCCCHRVPFFQEFRSIMPQPLHLRSTLFLIQLCRGGHARGEREGERRRSVYGRLANSRTN